MKKNNIEVIKDKKSKTFILYKTDSEGFHHAIFLTPREIDDAIELLAALSCYLH
jgi:hypothetical protein